MSWLICLKLTIWTLSWLMVMFGLVLVSLNPQFQVESYWTNQSVSKVQYSLYLQYIHYAFTFYIIYIYYIRQIKVCANYNIYNISSLSFKENSSKMTILGTHGTNQSVSNLQHLLY